MRLKIYAGLSLSEAEARAVFPDCEFAGPIGRDDLRSDVGAGVQVVIIIDGRFQQSLAVSPAEIMDALRCGVRIYGASSMGALRAAELGPYGMVGSGAIYELIAAEPWFRDDFLGQIFSERDLASPSAPYINVHFGLRAARDQGAISEEERGLLDEILRDTHFIDRDLSSFTKLITDRELPRQERLLMAAEQAVAHDQKKLDALGVLRLAEGDLARIAELNAQLLASLRATDVDERFEPGVELHVGVLLGP